MNGMAFFSDLARAVAQAEGMDEMTVVGIGQYLRDEGLIAKGGRGRSAARMLCRDAANLLIAVNATQLAKHAAETVRGFRELRHSVSAHDLAHMRLDEFVTETSIFGDALEQLILCSIPIPNELSQLELFLQKEKTRNTTRIMSRIALKHKIEIPTPKIIINFARPQNGAGIKICTPYLNFKQDAFLLSDGIGHSIIFDQQTSTNFRSDRRDLTTITDATLRCVALAINT